MARQKNPTSTIQITLSIPVQLRGYLDVMCRTGLYGKNPADVASTLLGESVRRMLKDADEVLLEELKREMREWLTFEKKRQEMDGYDEDT